MLAAHRPERTRAAKAMFVRLLHSPTRREDGRLVDRRRFRSPPTQVMQRLLPFTRDRPADGAGTGECGRIVTLLP